ncbi:hypothetical protein AB0I52_21110 [Streptomyces sp. NPDC050423]|uniref:hypothetical protein n=1 Tax=Streptomyces sp. NPDC050423 TaxID=3155402 RepID=UPI00341376A9
MRAPPIVAQRAEVTRRIQDGVPPKLKIWVFAARALVSSQTGRVHAAVGDERAAQRDPRHRRRAPGPVVVRRPPCMTPDGVVPSSRGQ